jgi:hypothetical protein
LVGNSEIKRELNRPMSRQVDTKPIVREGYVDRIQLSHYKFERWSLTNIAIKSLKSSQAISRAKVELKTNVSESCSGLIRSPEKVTVHSWSVYAQILP